MGLLIAEVNISTPYLFVTYFTTVSVVTFCRLVHVAGRIQI